MNRRVRVWRHRAPDLARRVERYAERDLLLGAAEAGMPEPDRPRAVDVAEMLDRAVRVRHRPLASELVEAVTVPVALVAVLLREATGVEVRAPRTVLVNRLALRVGGGALGVARRQRAGGRGPRH